MPVGRVPGLAEKDLEDRRSGVYLKAQCTPLCVIATKVGSLIVEMMLAGETLEWASRGGRYAGRTVSRRDK